MKAGVDRWLLLVVIGLTLWGLLMVYSSGSAVGVLVEGKGSVYYLERQIGKAFGGLAVMLILSFMPPRLLKGRVAYAGWGAVLGVLAFLVAARFVAGEGNGPVSRWLPILGGRIQPAEFARVALVVALAACLGQRLLRPGWTAWALPVALIVPAAALVALQPSLSMAAILGVSGFALLFVSGIPWGWIAPPAALLAAVGFFFRADYQGARIHNYVGALRGIVTGKVLAAPNEQVEQALIAFGSGGLLGQGVGRGLQKFKFLSQPHTDFILAIHGEETGLLGVVILLGLEAFVVWRIFRIGARACDPYARLLCFGVGIQIALLVLIHTAVNLGVAPTTGVPLPFISFGGSALVTNLIGIGLVLGVSRHDQVTWTGGPLDAGPARWRAA